MEKVEVAFRISNTKENQEKISSIYEPKFASYFLTKEPTTLGCIIQGPFLTTPGRDLINFEDDWNQKLILETAILIAEAITKIKIMGLLDVSFLNTLPINKEKLALNPAMIPIYHKTREILNSKEALLPTADGHFVSSRQALLVRGKDLVELLTSTQLQQLFGRTTWLDSDITRDVNPPSDNI